MDFLPLNVMFWKCLSDPFDSWHHLILEFSYAVFVRMACYIGESGVLKSPTIIMLRLIYVFIYNSICFIKSGETVFGE